jgi:prostaglandin-H2 D-isomerase / glutathione transferase
MSALSSSILNNCKLTYFSLPGRGEACRLALSYGGISFEDERVEFGDWGGMKSTMPFLSMPVLTLADGARISNQRTILRLIGKHTNLYPMDDHVTAARVDEVLDCCEDIGTMANNAGAGMDKDEKLKARVACVADGGIVAQRLQCLENFIKEHGSDGHCVGNNTTIADLFVGSLLPFQFSGFLDGIDGSTLERYPAIQNVRKTTMNLPQLQNYINARANKTPADAFLASARQL